MNNILKTVMIFFVIPLLLIKGCISLAHSDENLFRLKVAETCFRGHQWQWNENYGTFIKDQPNYCFIGKPTH